MEKQFLWKKAVCLLCCPILEENNSATIAACHSNGYKNYLKVLKIVDRFKNLELLCVVVNTELFFDSFTLQNNLRKI